MMTLEEYLAKIPPLHADKDRFRRTIELTVQPMVDAQVLLRAMMDSLFDLDVAVWDQLDKVGTRVGVSRLVPYPKQNLWFSFDTPGFGWDEGIWQQNIAAGIGFYSLEDDTYRRLIRARIIANSWDGTTTQLEQMLSTYLIDPATKSFVSDDSASVDGQAYFAFDDPNRGWDVGEWEPSGLPGYPGKVSSVSMQMTIGIAGKIPSRVDLAVLQEGLVTARPEGVAVETLITTVDETPLFGFDMDNEFVSGWDSGSWGATTDYLLSQTP